MGKNVEKINAAWWRGALLVGALWAPMALVTLPNKGNAASFSQQQTEYTDATNISSHGNRDNCNLNDKRLENKRSDFSSSSCVLERKINLNDYSEGSLVKLTKIYLNYTNRLKRRTGLMGEEPISDPQVCVHESLLQTIRSLFYY